MFFKHFLFEAILVTSLCCQYSFAHNSEQIFHFAQDGTIKISSQNDCTAPAQRKILRYSYKISDNGSFIITHNEKNFSGKPGDYIFPVLEKENFIWLLSEKNCNFARYVCWCFFLFVCWLRKKRQQHHSN